jgi:hypothetical protein
MLLTLRAISRVPVTYLWPTGWGHDLPDFDGLSSSRRLAGFEKQIGR